jgi:hypothetical protein
MSNIIKKMISNSPNQMINDYKKRIREEEINIQTQYKNDLFNNENKYILSSSEIDKILDFDMFIDARNKMFIDARNKIESNKKLLNDIKQMVKDCL